MIKNQMIKNLLVGFCKKKEFKAEIGFDRRFCFDYYNNVIFIQKIESYLNDNKNKNEYLQYFTEKLFPYLNGYTSSFLHELGHYIFGCENKKNKYLMEDDVEKLNLLLLTGHEITPEKYFNFYCEKEANKIVKKLYNKEKNTIIELDKKIKKLME